MSFTIVNSRAIEMMPRTKARGIIIFGHLYPKILLLNHPFIILGIIM
jgi:hypothetical protein